MFLHGKSIVSKISPIKIILLTTFTYGFLLFLVYNYSGIFREQQFVHLADSFLHGKFYFLQVPSISGWADTSFFGGHYYWPLGIFPAILLMPFVAIFGVSFSQGYLSFILTCISTLLIYKILEKLTEKRIISAYLSFAYIFSTAYIMVGLAPFSWYFAHVVATFCLLFSLYFTVVKQSPFFAGLFFTFAFLTRISIILGIIFFILYYFFFENKNYVKKILVFCFPIFLGILIFFAYNYVRFGNIMETGYRYQILFPELAANREVGMWSLKHFPEHIYLLFLQPPEARYFEGTLVLQRIKAGKWGMSFIYTSPILLYLIFVKIKNKLNLSALAAVLAIAFFLFGSYGLGSYQYGYRFALDFQPFLFLMLSTVFKERKKESFIYPLIIISFLINLMLTFSFFTV